MQWTWGDTKDGTVKPGMIKDLEEAARQIRAIQRNEESVNEDYWKPDSLGRLYDHACKVLRGATDLCMQRMGADNTDLEASIIERTARLEKEMERARGYFTKAKSRSKLAEQVKMVCRQRLVLLEDVCDYVHHTLGSLPNVEKRYVKQSDAD